MRATTTGWFRTAAAAGLLLLGAAGVSWAQSEGEPSACARTMQTFLATVDKAKTIQFEMTIFTRRRGEITAVPEVRRYRISVSRPDRLAVVPLTPDTAQFGMVSDGEELLCYTPYSRQYCVVDAPETLRGIDETVFTTAHDFEMLRALLPFIGDPHGWQDRDPSWVREGEAMGETEYAGVPCEVILGKNEVAYFEKDKRTLYRGRQTTGEGSRMFDPSTNTGIREQPLSVTIDKWILDGAISGSEFSVKPPPGYERVKDLKALPPEPDFNRRAPLPGPAIDLPANASVAEVRQRALTLFTTGYHNNPVTGQLFQRAADRGDPLAGMWVACLQEKGQAGFPADPAAAQKSARPVATEVKRLAETGNPEAQFLWGAACVDGLGTPANPAEGLRWLLQAAEKGDLHAMCDVGTLLRTGQAGTRDEVKGFQWIEKAARQGEEFAIANMGFLYHWGVGVEPDRGKALAWHMKARCLGYTRGVEIALLRRCEKPHPFTADAIHRLPYVKLFGTPAEDLPKLAVAAGVVLADTVLLPLVASDNNRGNYYYKTKGIEFESAFGRTCAVGLCAQSDNGFAQFTGELPLGLVRDDTQESVAKKLGPPDETNAEDGTYLMFYRIEDLSLAVNLDRAAPGHVKYVKITERWATKPQTTKPPAPVLAGSSTVIAQAPVTPVTPSAEPEVPAAVVRAKARARYLAAGPADTGAGGLFQKAADLGDPLAVMWVARLQQQGRSGFPVDPAAAEKLARTVAAEVKRLAETGNPEAQFLWGTACLAGLGTPANPDEARRWLLEAAEKGDAFAMNNAGSLLMDGKGGPRDEAKGVEWIEKAAQAGNSMAIANMGSFYHWGVGVAPDRDKAREWYMKATDLGYDQADNVGLLTGGETAHPFTADAIRQMSYVKLFGTRLEEVPKAAVAAGIVPADAVFLAPALGDPAPFYVYKKNGILFGLRFERIRTVEIYAQGAKGYEQFRGQLPLGLIWDDTRESVSKKLGPPDGQRDVPRDAAYEMVYTTDNLTLAVMFNVPAPGHVKFVRIYERWAQPQAKTPPTASAKEK